MMAARSQRVSTEALPIDTMTIKPTLKTAEHSGDLDYGCHSDTSEQPARLKESLPHLCWAAQSTLWRRSKSEDRVALDDIPDDTKIMQRRSNSCRPMSSKVSIFGPSLPLRPPSPKLNDNSKAKTGSNASAIANDLSVPAQHTLKIPSTTPSVKQVSLAPNLARPVVLGTEPQHPETLVLIDNVYVLWFSFDHPNFSNDSDMDLRMCLDQELEQSCQQQRGSRLKYDYLLQLTYAGIRKDDLRPSVVLTTSSKKTRKLMKKSLSSKHIRNMLREFQRDLWLLIDSHQLASDTKPTTWPKEEVLIRVELPQARSFCGSKLHIYVSGSLKAGCVLGGFILIGTQMYGLTASHPFPSDISGSDNLVDASNTLQDDGDDSSDDEGPFHISCTDDSIRREKTDHVIIGMSIPPEPPSLSKINEPWSRNTVPDEISPFLRLSCRGVLSNTYDGCFFPFYDGPNADWCALALSNTQVNTDPNYYQNKIAGNTISAICDFHHDQDCTVTIALPDGHVPGTLKPQSVIHRIDTQIFELRLITVKQPIPAGCSGAWVVHDNQLCGILLLVQQRLPWIYMIPFSHVKRDIEMICGEQVRLPKPLIEIKDPVAAFESVPTSHDVSHVITGKTSCDQCASRQVECEKQLPSCSYCQQNHLTCTWSTLHDSRPSKRLRMMTPPVSNVQRSLETRAQPDHKLDENDNNPGACHSDSSLGVAHGTTTDKAEPRWLNASETWDAILSHTLIREALLGAENVSLDANTIFSRIRQITAKANGSEPTFRESDVHQIILQILNDAERATMSTTGPLVSLDEAPRRPKSKPEDLLESEAIYRRWTKIGSIEEYEKHTGQVLGLLSYPSASARQSAEPATEAKQGEAFEMAQRMKGYETLIKQQHATLRAQIALIEEIEPSLKNQGESTAAADRAGDIIVDLNAAPKAISNPQLGKMLRNEQKSHARQAESQNTEHELNYLVQDMGQRHMADQISRHVHSWLAATSLDSLDPRPSKHATPLDQGREKRHIPDSRFPLHAFDPEHSFPDDDDDVGSPPVELAVVQARTQDREHHSHSSSP